MSDGFPPGYCATGASVKMRESDFRTLRNEHLQSAEFWHRSLKRTVAEKLQHQGNCAKCGSGGT